MGFTGNISMELAAVGRALLTGAAMGILYDLFRILRRLFRFGYAMILTQDLLFWMLGAIGVFFSSVVVYGGQLRLIFVFAALAGWALYAATVGQVFMLAVDWVLKIMRKVWSFAKQRAIMPIACRVNSAIQRIWRLIAEKNCRIVRKIHEKCKKTS